MTVEEVANYLLLVRHMCNDSSKVVTWPARPMTVGYSLSTTRVQNAIAHDSNSLPRSTPIRRTRVMTRWAYEGQRVGADLSLNAGGPMKIWSVDGVDGEPEITLVRWRILETDEGDRHLVGAREDDFTGMVSTAITTFDLRGWWQ
jgi:hypothetical protein